MRDIHPNHKTTKIDLLNRSLIKKKKPSTNKQYKQQQQQQNIKKNKPTTTTKQKIKQICSFPLFWFSFSSPFCLPVAHIL